MTCTLGSLLGQSRWDYLRPSGLSDHSGQLEAGDLFVAVPGERSDGRGYINEAIDGGAAAVLYDPEGFSRPVARSSTANRVPVIAVPRLRHRLGELAAKFWGYPGRSMRLAGITGTNGKSSTVHYLSLLSNAVGVPMAALGTLGAGVPGDPLGCWGNFTTPPPPVLQRALACVRERGVQSAALEVSSHALAQGRTEPLEFAVGVFTNLTQDHLDYHGDMPSYGEAKARLFDSVVGSAVLNIDDPFGAALGDRLAGRMPVLRYGLNAVADLRLSEVVVAPTGMRAQLHWQGHQRHLSIPLLGSFNAMNLLAALGAALALGADIDALCEATAALHPPLGRMQVVSAAGQPLTVVDYAHTPDALDSALGAMRAHWGYSIGCLFGCGGDRDCGKRPLMGAVASRGADWLVLTDDNRRSEASADILADISVGIEGSVPVREEPDRARAIDWAVGRMQRARDALLIAGKGHETWQILGDQRIEFSDTEQAKASLVRHFGMEAR